MESNIEIAMLYDLYGALLTERQREVVEQYYLDDLSLTEIASNLSVSKQAVSEQLRRSEDKLREMEKQLGFKKRLRAQNELLRTAIKLLESEPSPKALQDCTARLRNIIDRRIAE